jgi:hypothetical protein
MVYEACDVQCAGQYKARLYTTGFRYQGNWYMPQEPSDDIWIRWVETRMNNAFVDIGIVEHKGEQRIVLHFDRDEAWHLAIEANKMHIDVEQRRALNAAAIEWFRNQPDGAMHTGKRHLVHTEPKPFDVQ